ncbi:MAG: hypothetical protein ACHQ3P_02920 [Candidatus Limnocylindrales bacterium]
MTDDRSLERAARSWIETGPTRAPEGAVQRALLLIETTPQERDLRIPRRFTAMTLSARVVAAAVIGVLVIGGAFYMLRPGQANLGPAGAPTPSSQSTASAAPTSGATPSSAPASVAAGPTSSPIRLTDLPGHGRIAFTRALGPNASTVANVFTIEPNGTGLTSLTHLTAGCERDPAWSPSGDRIVFGIGVPAKSACDSSTSQYVASMDATGGSVRRLTTVPNGVFDDSPVVSPDGSKIAFSRFDTSGTLTGIWLMNVDGSHLVRVTTTPPAASAGGDQSPAFSPDGSKLAFARDRTDNGNGSIYVVGIDGSGLRQVVPETIDAARPAFSPDGSLILFSNLDTASTPQGHNVSVVNADGSGLRQLTNEVGDDSAGDAAWSPDGTMIVFIHYHGGDNFVAIAVMKADGSAQTVIWHPTPQTDDFPGAPSWGTAP